jgi:hypothetical protein
MEVPVYNLSTQEAEEGRSGVPGQPELNSKTKERKKRNPQSHSSLRITPTALSLIQPAGTEPTGARH